VAHNRLGTAYGLMTMLQNIGMMAANLAAGVLNDASGAGPANPGGYRHMLWMFFILSAISMVFAAALRRRETSATGHGLESIRASGL
jgi:MFS family permease